jgi:hypothetical protein
MSKDLIQQPVSKVWERRAVNVMLFSKDRKWWISYNPSTHVGMEGWAGDGSGEETALCKDDQYFILNGDFRKEYEALIDKGFKACKKFFDDHEEDKSSWSN